MKSLLLTLLLPSLAFAHGGLPISEALIPRGGQLYVPTKYWGVFIGTDGGPWRWICEEAINKKQDRRWALTLDGTFHVTNSAGVTSSRDGGCTWLDSTSDLALRSTSAVVADPVDGKRAWVTTNAGADVPWNALYTTADDGQSWTPTLKADEYLRGAALSADGKVIYVTGVSRETPDMGALVPSLHVSKDGGATWSQTPLAFMLGGYLATAIEPIAVDPADPGTVYLHVTSDPTHVLLRATKFGAAVAEALRVEGDIGGVAFEASRQRIYAATKVGLFRSTDGGATFQMTGNLSQAQCVMPSGDGKSLYACSWNYVPDNAAIARSDDGGEHFVKVFQYADTLGPVRFCPADSPVGKICPDVWQMYASQLGIDSSPVDGGGSDGGTPPIAGGCHCDIGGPTGASAGVTGLLAAAAIGGLLRRRRARRS